MSTYAWIILGSFIGPLLLSFDQKVGFYKHMRSISLGILIVAFPFLIWDELFTQWGVWGFTEHHLLGIYFGHLPMEEVMFFFVVLIAAVLSLGALISKSYWLQYFSLTYLVALIPFIIVNGILTGAATDSPVVWYNENEIIGWRIITIPYEDLFYNFDLIFLVILIHQFLRYKPITSQAA